MGDITSPTRVLFLCTGNSARSILGEVALNVAGRGQWLGLSAGSKPRGQVHPMALEVLQDARMPTGNLRSKNWSVFAEPGTAQIDLVITVCDSAAAETCPVWPGQPLSVHWGVPDPAAVPDAQPQAQKAAFQETLKLMRARARELVRLDLRKLSVKDAKNKLAAIAKAHPAPVALPAS